MKVRLHWTTYISEERSATFVLEDLPEKIRSQIEGILELDDGDIPLGVVDMDYDDARDDVSELVAEHEEDEARIVDTTDRRINGVEFLPEVPHLVLDIDPNRTGEPSSRIDDPVGDLEEQLEERNG